METSENAAVSQGSKLEPNSVYARDVQLRNSLPKGYFKGTNGTSLKTAKYREFERFTRQFSDTGDFIISLKTVSWFHAYWSFISEPSSKMITI